MAKRTDSGVDWMAVLNPSVSRDGRTAALRVVLVLAVAVTVLAAFEDLLIWRLDLPWLHKDLGDVAHEAFRLAVLGFIAWRAALYAVSRLEEAQRELENADGQMLGRFAKVVEMHDSYRRGRAERIGLYAREVGLAMGLDPGFCEDLLRTAVAHDIGEVAVPDAVRHKTGPLTAFEHLRLMDHVEAGTDLLAGQSRLLRMAQRIARHHHEAWNGTGYPDGLAGEAIPLEARIVAVVDAFDAMLSDRPFREAFSWEHAVQEILRASGTRYDPGVLDGFAEALPALAAIRNRLAEEPSDSGLLVELETAQ